LSWVKGNHTWRFGVDHQNVDTEFIDRFDITGTYTFQNFSFFAGGVPTRLQQNFGGVSALLNKYTGVFAQDEWHVRPNITISAGLRYERETVLDDNNNWGPRFAIAWNPFKNSANTVVRFGAGIFYNRVLLRTVDDYASDSSTLRLDTNSLNLPPGVSVTQDILRTSLANLFPNGATLDTLIQVNATRSFTVEQLSRASTVFRSLSPDLVIPESYQLNAGFEREIRKGLVFETNVTYNKTIHLWREMNPNAPVLPSGLSDVNNDGRVTFTDYLLGITTGPNRFEALSGPDPIGSHPLGGTGPCTTSTPICVVNVNTSNNNSSTTCSTTTTTNTPVCRAFAAVNPLRPYWSVGPDGGPGLGAVQLEQVNAIGNSRYIGAIFELRNRYRRFSNGFGGSWRLDYTLSRLMDDGIVNTSEATTPGDFSKEWSRSLADRTHRIAFTASIDTPRWLGKLRISPLFRWGSSAPFNVSAGTSGGGIDRNLDDIQNDRPSFTGDPNDINWRVYGSTFPSDLAARFSFAPIGSPGTLGRNAGHGPQLWQFNVNITREFRFSERFRLRPSFETTNPLNMRIFSFGSNFINLDNITPCSSGGPLPAAQQTICDSFLAPTRTMTHRRMRLGLRFDF
jgi:hypothetical protein